MSKPQSHHKKEPETKNVVKDNCIILNKSFTGEWLNKNENSIAHEIINFFRADDKNIYIYNIPYGQNVRNSENLNIKYLFLTTAKLNGTYYLEYCVEIKQSLHNCSISREKQNENNRDELIEKVKKGKNEIEETLKKSCDNIKYDKVSINNLFADNVKVLPFTYLAKKVYKAKRPIAIVEKALTKELDYNFARNYGSVLKSKNPKSYNHFLSCSPDNKPQDWVDFKPTKFIKLENTPKNNSILKSLDQNTFLDMVDNFKMEECYTKILLKLMEFDKRFINTFLEHTLGASKTNQLKKEIFVPKDEYVIKDFGRLDIYAESESKKYLLIIENKIDSLFTMKKGRSQLLRYYKWATSNEKKEYKPIYIIVAPDYRLEVVKTEERRLREEEGFDQYTVVGYSKVYDAFVDFVSNHRLDSFKYYKYLDDIELLFLRMSLKRKDIYTAKITNRINSLKF